MQMPLVKLLNPMHSYVFNKLSPICKGAVTVPIDPYGIYGISAYENMTCIMEGLIFWECLRSENSYNGLQGKWSSIFEFADLSLKNLNEWKNISISVSNYS